MCGIKNVLVFGLLLGATYARPDGYGVKGVKSFGATANAAASAHAFANTGFGGLGIAQSSATASADANTGGTPGAGNAAATTNAFVNGENIGKAISSASAIANVNHPIGRSDVLDQSSDREKDTEYKTTNHQDGTPAWNQDVANAGHGGCGNNGNSAPGSIDLTNPATVCHPGDLKCRNSKNKPSVSNPNPTYNEHPDLPAGSSQPLPNLDGGWGGNTATPGSRPCTSGNQKCSGGQPNVPKPDQSHDKHVELSANSGRPVTKPSVSNPYPSYNEHPDLSAGSSQRLPNLDGGWGGNTATSGSRPCTSGNQKCSVGQPNVPKMDQSHDKHVELSANSGKPATNPSVSKTYPSHNEHPDLSAGSLQPLPNLDGGWGGNTATPGSRPCASGNQKCSGQPNVPKPDQSHDKHVELSANSGKPATKPSVSNPYPSYNEHPDLSAGSSQPLPNLDGGWGGNTATPGYRPCTSGNQKCSGGQPNVPKPDQSHDKHVELSANSGKPATKPSGSNPYPSYNEHPYLSAGSSQPLPNLDGGWGGHKSIKPTGGRDDVKGSHQHPTFNKNPYVPTGSSLPLPNLGSDCRGTSTTPGSKACNSGSSGSKPGTSNPFLNGKIDVSEIQKDVKSAESSPETSGSKTNPSNPFLNPHSQHPSTSTGGIHHSGKPYDNDKPESSTQYHQIKPNPSNPFLNPHSQQLPTPTGSTHHSEKPINNNQGRPSDQYPESKPNPSNPFLNPHSQHPSAPPGSSHNSEKPNNNNLGRPSDQYPESKPNPSNPFLNPHNPQYPSPSIADKHDLENQNGNDETGASNQYPHNQKLPSNPIPTHHGHDEVKGCLHGSCKPKGPKAGNDAEHSDTTADGNQNTSGRPSDGVKSHRPGVKGGSPYRPQSSVPITYQDSGHGDKASPDANASWDAYSKAHASASADGNGSAQAKSQAYSSADSSGWSSSWASSSASASASAYSSSSH